MIWILNDSNAKKLYQLPNFMGEVTQRDLFGFKKSLVLKAKK